MTSRPTRPMLRAALVAPAVLAFAMGTASPAAAATRLTRDGWWTQNDPGVPAVPGDAVAVAAVAGSPQKVAAYDIDLGLSAGAVIDNVTLVLPEAAGSVAAAQGKLTACLITAPWVAAHKGAWAQRPTWDCTAGAGESIRSADGVWTFDLTSVAKAWQGRSTPRGVAIIPSPGSTATFEVHLAGVTSSAAKVNVVTAAPASAGEDAEPTFSEPAPTETSDGFSSSSTGGLDLPPLPPPAPLTLPAPVRDREVVLAAPASSKAVAATGARAGHLFGNYDLSTLLLVPLVLGLAAALGVALGPEGDPAGLRRREGGVSRALARRAEAEPHRQEHR